MMSHIGTGNIASQYSPYGWLGPLQELCVKAHKFLYERFDEMESGTTVILED